MPTGWKKMVKRISKKKNNWKPTVRAFYKMFTGSKVRRQEAAAVAAALFSKVYDIEDNSLYPTDTEFYIDEWAPFVEPSILGKTKNEIMKTIVNDVVFIDREYVGITSEGGVGLILGSGYEVLEMSSDDAEAISDSWQHFNNVVSTLLGKTCYVEGLHGGADVLAVEERGPIYAFKGVR